MLCISCSSIRPTTHTCLTREVQSAEGRGGRADQEEEHGLGDGRGKEHLEVGVGGELLEEREGGAHDAPLDRGEDGGGGREGQGLGFNGELVEEH